MRYALVQLSLFGAKRHRTPTRYGWKLVTYESPNCMGLINLNGRVVAPRPNRPWREMPSAGGKTSVSRVKENPTHGSMGAGETNASRPRRAAPGASHLPRPDPRTPNYGGAAGG